MKVAGNHIHSTKGNPRPPARNDGPGQGLTYFNENTYANFAGKKKEIMKVFRVWVNFLSS